MEQVVDQAVADSFIREWAAFIVRGLGDNDLSGQVAKVTDFVRTQVTYARDPVNQEYLIHPRQMLAQYHTSGTMVGDCDDHVMLLNSLLGALGFTTVCLGVISGGGSEYNHVISGVKALFCKPSSLTITCNCGCKCSKCMAAR